MRCCPGREKWPTQLAQKLKCLIMGGERGRWHAELCSIRKPAHLDYCRCTRLRTGISTLVTKPLQINLIHACAMRYTSTGSCPEQDISLFISIHELAAVMFYSAQC